MTADLAHERIEVEDTAVAVLRFKNGALGVIEAATSAYPGLLEADRDPRRPRLGPGRAGRHHPLGVPGQAPGRRRDPRGDGPASGSSAPAPATRGGSATPATATSSPTSSRPSTGRRPPFVDGREGRKSVEIIRAIYHRPGPAGRSQLPLGIG